MTKLDGTELVLDFLKGLPPKQAAQIAKKVLALGVDPRPPDSQKLSGYDFFRVDFGEYRIVYELDPVDDVVRLILIGKRNDDEIYKLLKRK